MMDVGIIYHTFHFKKNQMQETLYDCFKIFLKWAVYKVRQGVRRNVLTNKSSITLAALSCHMMTVTVCTLTHLLAFIAIERHLTLLSAVNTMVTFSTSA